MFVQDGFLYLIVTKHKLTVYFLWVIVYLDSLLDMQSMHRKYPLDNDGFLLLHMTSKILTQKFIEISVWNSLRV